VNSQQLFSRRIAVTRFALDRAAIALIEGRLTKAELRARVLSSLDALERIAPLPCIHGGVPARHHLTMGLDCLDHGLCAAEDMRNIFLIDIDAIEAACSQSAH
jgi:hypothetical protein